MLAPLGTGGDFVAAVQRFGKNSSTLVLRIHADGKIDDPVGSYPGPPLFLVANESRVLFGYSEGGTVLRLAILGPDGKQIGNAAAAPFAASSPIHDQLRASAKTTGDGWVVATGGAELSAPVEVVRVAADGTLGARKRAGVGTSTIVAGGDGAVIVFRSDDGLRIHDEPMAAGASALLARDQPFQLLAAAQGSGRTLMVWMELGVGRVVRLTRRAGQDATSIASVASVPGTRPVVGAVSGATVYLLFADEALRADPAIYVEER